MYEVKEVADILLGSRPNLVELGNRAFQMEQMEWIPGPGCSKAG